MNRKGGFFLNLLRSTKSKKEPLKQIDISSEFVWEHHFLSQETSTTYRLPYKLSSLKTITMVLPFEVFFQPLGLNVTETWHLPKICIQSYNFQATALVAFWLFCRPSVCSNGDSRFLRAFRFIDIFVYFIKNLTYSILIQ